MKKRDQHRQSDDIKRHFVFRNGKQATSTLKENRREM